MGVVFLAINGLTMQPDNLIATAMISLLAISLTDSGWIIVWGQVQPARSQALFLLFNLLLGRKRAHTSYDKIIW